MIKEELLPKLRGLIAERFIHANEAAKNWGISPTYLSKILNDPETQISDVILVDLGYKRITTKTTVYISTSE